MLDFSNLCDIISNADAALAHLVERHLAKVEVASSSLVGRSTKTYCITVQVQVLLPAPRQKNSAPFRFRGLRKSRENCTSAESFFLYQIEPASLGFDLDTGSDLDSSGAPLRVFMTDLRCGHFFVEMKQKSFA